jgi:hypothetical protein
MRARVAPRALAVAWILCGACAGGPGAPAKPPPRLPEGNAGSVLARAIDAAGGWERWLETHDVSFVTTLTILDRTRDLSSESIGWYMAPLHRGMRARMESIGMPTPITFGIDGNETWILRDGERLNDPARLAITRFDLVSNLFWFSLPFSLAEMPATVTDLGSISEGNGQWDRLKVQFDPSNHGVPGEWFVLYFDHDTGLIDHVHARLIAPFLRHQLWVGKWLQYRDCGGLKKERQRQFFPADADGTIVGPMIAEQLIEHVRLNNGFTDQLFNKPPKVTDAEPVRAWGLEAWGAGIGIRKVCFNDGEWPVDSFASGVFHAAEWH